MSEHSQRNLVVTRRHWLALAASAVSGCGGGSADTTALLPGTGGTGYTQGAISGFGSVFVNGVEFDDVMASANGSIQIDGVAVTSDYLRLGMVAGVQSERGVDPAPPKVLRIDVWSIAQGLVVSAAHGVVTEFSVAGMTVQADSSTVFDKLANAGVVAPGQRVAVWGLQAGAAGTQWKATRVALVTDTALVSTGVVQVSGLLNGLSLTGAAAGTLTAGALVRVQGIRSEGGNGLLVTHAKVLGSGLVGQLPDDAKIEVEIEGVVTDTPTASGFMLGNIMVDASAIAPISAQIKKGTRLEVHGTWQSRVLKATKVEIEDEQALQSVELKGLVESFKGVADFLVRGQRCDASGLSNADVSHGTLADLSKKDVKVKLKGSMAGDVVRVSQLEIVMNDD